MSFKDKLVDYRNRYRRLKSKASKGRFVTRLCEVFDLERKYVLKLLNGQREFKAARGRGRTYGREVELMAVRLRRAAGDPCAVLHGDAAPARRRLGGAPRPP